jgi:DNA mismatch repair protein MutL
LLINNTLKQAYHTVLPEKRFPLAVINLKIDPRGVDVNVHPNKHEVKFLDEKGITQAVHQAVTNAFTKAGLIIDIDDTPQSDHEHAFTGNSSDLSDLKNTDSNSIRSNNFGLKDSEKSKYKTSFSNNTENPVQSTIFSNAPVRNKAFTSNLNHADSVGSAGSAESTGSPESIGSPGPIGSGVPASRSKSPFETDSFEYNSKVFESNHPRLSEAIVKGQIFNTYILAENQNEMLMLDQHIVHERILYEQYMNQYFDSDFASQGLLFPLIIELSATDKQIMHKNMYILQKLGFTIEPFGGNNFLIKTVPVILGKIEEKEAIYEILDTLMTTLYVKKIEELKEALIIKTACHNAVKANQALNIGSMQNLVNMLSQTKNPYTCPHGRPIVVSLSEKEIKRRFKRT